MLSLDMLFLPATTAVTRRNVDGPRSLTLLRMLGLQSRRHLSLTENACPRRYDKVLKVHRATRRIPIWNALGGFKSHRLLGYHKRFWDI